MKIIRVNTPSESGRNRIAQDLADLGIKTIHIEPISDEIANEMIPKLDRVNWDRFYNTLEKRIALRFDSELACLKRSKPALVVVIGGSPGIKCECKDWYMVTQQPIDIMREYQVGVIETIANNKKDLIKLAESNDQDKFELMIYFKYKIRGGFNSPGFRFRDVKQKYESMIKSARVDRTPCITHAEFIKIVKKLSS